MISTTHESHQDGIEWDHVVRQHLHDGFACGTNTGGSRTVEVSVVTCASYCVPLLQRERDQRVRRRAIYIWWQPCGVFATDRVPSLCCLFLASVLQRTGAE